MTTAIIFRRRQAAFTMIEIAISLAVIGFALVAIIGILPTGMNVQKENREQTVINQDFGVFIDALRSGARGFDDLTNYVFAITNYVTEFSALGKPMNNWVNGHTYRDSSTVPKFPITNGFRIVGLLSTPKYTADPLAAGKSAGGYLSNYVVAFVRSLSGVANEKFPQNNTNVQDLALSYRLVTEVIVHSDLDRNWTNYTDPAIVTANNTNEIISRSNYWMFAKNLQTNLHDVRMIFRWPLLRNGEAGPGRQVFRTMIGGNLLSTNDSGFPIYFFESRNYVKATP
jgi:type II secretory pathway pseudopilin PulG